MDMDGNRSNALITEIFSCIVHVSIYILLFLSISSSALNLLSLLSFAYLFVELVVIFFNYFYVLYKQQVTPCINFNLFVKLK